MEPIIPDEEIPKPAPSVSFIKNNYLWNNTKNSENSVRAICMEENLDIENTNILVACLKVESKLNPKCVSKRNKNGTRDWGICQYNDGVNKRGVPYWIGNGAKFPSTRFVLDNPAKCVRLMAQLFKQGRQSLWSSFNNGSYKQFLT